MKIAKINLRRISQPGQCILIIHTDVNYLGRPSKEDRPEVQLQMPIAIATEIKEAVERNIIL